VLGQIFPEPGKKPRDTEKPHGTPAPPNRPEHGFQKRNRVVILEVRQKAVACNPGFSPSISRAERSASRVEDTQERGMQTDVPVRPTAQAQIVVFPVRNEPFVEQIPEVPNYFPPYEKACPARGGLVATGAL
jgi:hypothetical protein